MAKRQTAVLEAPGASAETPAPMPARKSIWDLVQDFYEALLNHPDAKLLGSDFNTRPDQHVMFTDATREAQRIVYLRFLMRWPTSK